MNRATSDSRCRFAGKATGAFSRGVRILGAALLLAACGKTDVYFGSPLDGSGDPGVDSDADGDGDSDFDPDSIVCDKGIYSLDSPSWYTNIKSADDLQSLAGYTGFSGRLQIQACPDCTDLDPLVCLEWVTEDLTVRTNGSLTDLTGLSSLKLLGGDLEIKNNDALVSLDGLGALTSVDRFAMIAGNDALVSLEGLASLTTIGRGLVVEDNPVLEDLDGLDGITSLNESLTIAGNTTLTNLDGLSGLTYVGEGSLVGEGVDIWENPALPDCEVCGLLDQLTTGSVAINVHDNLDDDCTPVPDSCP